MAEVHENQEKMAGEVLGLDKDSADSDTVGGGGGQEQQESQAEAAYWSQDTWQMKVKNAKYTRKQCKKR